MTYNVFPTFSGRGWGQKKRAITSTLVQEADSGAEFRSQRYQYPLYEFDIEIPYLLQADRQALEGFFIQQGGPFLPFYFSYDNDNSATNQAFGVGDGITVSFQITNNYSSFWSEPIGGVNGTPTIYVNGVATTPASISQSGLVTFATPPPAGAALTWTGGYFYLVRFKDDQLEIEQAMSALYDATTITLRTFR